MPIQQILGDDDDFQVSLQEDTPHIVRTDIDLRTYAYATVVVTPQHFPPGDLSDSDLLGLARFCGVYTAQTDRRLNLEGHGLIWWLGDESRGGDMYAGVDTTSTALDFEAQLDARVFAFSNGLTKGSVNATSTTRTIKIPGNLTRRQLLDTICAAYADPNYEWRVNPDFTVDADTQTNLYPTTTTPTAIFTEEGGRDGSIDSVRAILEIGSIDVEDYYTTVEVRWNETTPGTNNGAASNTPPSTWKAPDGDAPVIRQVLDWSPKKNFRQRPGKPDRWNAAHYAAWAVNSQTQANNLAKTHANQAGNPALEITADVDEYDPWRFAQVGDSVWCYDLDQGIVNTANEVYYRGSAVHPQKLRVQAMTTPIQEGYGVYLRYWDGAAFQLYDLTPYVAWEEDLTTYELGTRQRLHRKNARPRRFNRRRVRNQQRRNYLLARYLESVA